MAFFLLPLWEWKGFSDSLLLEGVQGGRLCVDSPTIYKQLTLLTWGITQHQCLSSIPTSLFVIIHSMKQEIHLNMKSKSLTLRIWGLIALDFSLPGVSNLYPMMAMNVAQRRIINLLKTLRYCCDCVSQCI